MMENVVFLKLNPRLQQKYGPVCSRASYFEMGALSTHSSPVIFLYCNYCKAFAHAACPEAIWPYLAQRHHLHNNSISILCSLAHSCKIVLSDQRNVMGLLNSQIF